MVTVTFTSQTFEFAPKDNQTWYSWATDDDYEIMELDGGDTKYLVGYEVQTLQKSVINGHNGEDKRIIARKYEAKAGTTTTYYLKYNGEYVLTTSEIVPGGTYSFSIY